MQKLILLLASFWLLAACHSHQSGGSLHLNNGEKWEVNAEMKPAIEAGNKILSEYLAQQGIDYKKLAEDLKNQNDKLIKSCTMKGESHDVLHQWLHPHMKLVEQLADAEDAQKAATIVAQLEQSFNTYQQYFK